MPTRLAPLLKLLFTVVLLLAPPAFANHGFSPIRADHVERLVLGKHLYSLEDAEGTLLLEDIHSEEIQQQFEPMFVDPPYLGRTHSTYWFRFQLDFVDSSQPLILEIGYPHLKHITLYQFSGGQVIQEVESGYAVADKNNLNCGRFCFLIRPAKGLQTVYLKISSDSPLFIPMTLRTPENQLKNERVITAMQALFYGAFLVMSLFNLFLFWSTREKSYFYYVLYIGALGIWTLSHDGILRELLLYRYEWLASYKVHFLLTLVSVGIGALFCQKFLKTDVNMPLHHKMFSFLILCVVVDSILIVVNNRIILPNSANLLTILACSTAISAGLLGILKDLKTARFFLIAWISVIIGSVGWILVISGIFPLNNFTAFSVQIGGLLETVLLSLALGDRINVLQAETIRIEKEANKKLEVTNKKLEASNQFKDEFLSTISHELRTPMNGIFGASELLENTQMNTEQVKYLSTISRSSRDMLGMIENILTYTQLEAGTASPENHPFKIREFLSELATHYRGRAAIQGLEFDFHLDATLPSDLEGDQDKLRLLLDHILDNAFKFTDHGKVSFNIKCESIDDESAQLKFIIKDSGCGVPESLHSEIFDSFKQADSSLTRRKGGLGIGLALSQKIVDILKGKLTFESVVSEGTTVTLLLNFTPCAESSMEALNSISETIDPETIDILVVEDNYVNKLVMEGQLKKLGFQVFSAGNGKEAVSMMEKREYDLVFMDCQMPIMDGFEATRLTRQLNNRNATIPVIAVTANTNPGDREACIAAGMNDYIKKPFNQATLIHAINRWLAYSDSGELMSAH